VRGILQPVIFSKLVNYHRDVKRRKIEPDPTIEEQLAQYKIRIKPAKQLSTHS
jgi:hypothetical protein